MANWYVSSVAYAAVAQWSAGAARSIGNIRRQLAAPAVGNERCFRCTTAGTTGGAEPSWNLTKGATTNDNGVVWTEVTGNEAYQAPGAWAAPAARVSTIMNSTSWTAAGDTIYLASNHAETQSSALTIANTSSGAANPHKMICVDSSGSSHVPPQAGDMTTGATISVTGNSSINVTYRGLYCYGISWLSGVGSATYQNIVFGTNATSWYRFDSCNFTSATTSTSGGVTFSSSTSYACEVDLVNTSITVGNATHTLGLAGVNFVWRDTATPIVGATIPNYLFQPTVGTRVTLEGVDLTALGSGGLYSGAFGAPHTFYLKNCKLHSAARINPTLTGVNNQFPLLHMANCDSGSLTYRHAKYAGYTRQNVNALVVRTGGASDGVTPISWRIEMGIVGGVFGTYYESIPIVFWAAAGSVTVTMEGVYVGAVMPTNDEIWLAAEYMGSSGSPISSKASGGKASILSSASNLAASTAAWDGALPARANSTFYSAGDMVKVASNPGRVFIAGTGTTAGSEPGGFATAVDGDSILDNTVTFVAGVRFSQSLTFTTAQDGFVTVYIRAQKASAVYYVDPKVR